MSEEAPITESPEEPELKADRSWIGREVMVTRTGSVDPWYDGDVTRVTEDGDYVEVQANVITHGWFRKTVVLEQEWHRVEDVYLIHK